MFNCHSEMMRSAIDVHIACIIVSPQLQLVASIRFDAVKPSCNAWWQNRTYPQKKKKWIALERSNLFQGGLYGEVRINTKQTCRARYKHSVQESVAIASYMPCVSFQWSLMGELMNVQSMNLFHVMQQSPQHTHVRRLSWTYTEACWWMCRWQLQLVSVSPCRQD
jgi:hypothetical protein